MSYTLFTYQAKCEKVVDGDTLNLLIDQGLRNYRKEPIRLLGLNTPEVRGETREAGLAAKAFVTSWIDLASTAAEEFPLIIQTEKDPEKYGRYLATIWRKIDGMSLNAQLLESGHAVPYLV